MRTVLDWTILESLVPVSQERVERVEGQREGLGGKRLWKRGLSHRSSNKQGFWETSLRGPKGRVWGQR